MSVSAALPRSDRHRRRGRPRAGVGLEAFVNISQLTVSQMSLLCDDRLARNSAMHWLGRAGAELVRDCPWSASAPPSSSSTSFFSPMGRRVDRQGFGTIRLPFGDARTSPIDTQGRRGGHRGRPGTSGWPSREGHRIDRAEVGRHAGRGGGVLRGPRPDHHLRGRAVRWWCDRELRSHGLPGHVFGHVRTMAKLHADNRYDRLTHDFEAITEQARDEYPGVRRETPRDVRLKQTGPFIP